MGLRVACGLLLLASAGCERLLGLDQPSVPASDDAQRFDSPVVDSGIDADPTCVVDGFNFCQLTPGAARTFSSAATINTGSAADCNFFNFNQVDDNTNACLIYVTSLVVDAGVVVTAMGNPPLIIAVRDTIEISGTIDTKADANNLNTAACDATGGTNTGSGFGAGGGGGGGLGGAGAPGGDGESFQVAGGSGRGIGVLSGRAMRGGCRGGNGGAAGGATGGLGGSSGGAVRLISLGRITVSGAIRANGTGGGGGNLSASGGAGGGGGGSGGYLRIASGTEIVISGQVAANGGGGGGGGGSAAAGSPGDPGGLGLAAADGGAPAGGAGEGGSGGATTVARAGYDSQAAGGGGGGGGAGVIVLIGTVTNTGAISPNPQ